MLRLRGVTIVAIFALSFGETTLFAQSSASMEYIEASSPLKSGGKVTTRSLPGQGIQTVVSKSPLLPTEAATRETSSNVANPNSQPIDLAANVYPYPIVTQSKAEIPLCQMTDGSPVYQLTTLGLIPSSAYRSNWYRPTKPLFGNLFSNPPPTSIDTAPIPANTAPSIQYPQNPLADGTVPGGGFWSPTSVYAGNRSTGPQPLIKFKNMAPGSYLGQGIVGQPKAYVDGQPIRNLLRYVLPF